VAKSTTRAIADAISGVLAGSSGLSNVYWLHSIDGVENFGLVFEYRCDVGNASEWSNIVDEKRECEMAAAFGVDVARQDLRFRRSHRCGFGKRVAANGKRASNGGEGAVDA
jgi:hypothetical protein